MTSGVLVTPELIRIAELAVEYEELRRLLRVAVETGMYVPRFQCSGCREVFAQPYRPVCPSCNRYGFWTGSIDEEGQAKLSRFPVLQDIAKIREILR